MATYWSFLIWGLQNEGRVIAPSMLINALAILGTAVEVWGRYSMGRNIGFVPAQREIVVRGAYRFMRHPTYSGQFIGLLADSLAYYSPRNLVINGFAIFWFAIKSRVRWHWFPGLV